MSRKAAAGIAFGLWAVFAIGLIIGKNIAPAETGPLRVAMHITTPEGEQRTVTTPGGRVIELDDRIITTVRKGFLTLDCPGL